MSQPIPDVKSIFGRAAEIAGPIERAVFLDQACAGHPAIRAEVENLLGALEAAGSFMAAPAPLAAQTAPGTADGVGAAIGPYRLMEQIGEGGMGLVFVAEQHEPVRRKVALKVIKPGMDSRQVVARFEAERQALALMDHPNIAKVLDAGTTDAGRPYFVMELVKGIPITDYCDARNLPAKDRLGLFLQVCAAVQHAHVKGVIHRDLKPSNILVAPHDGVPVVKVIDFGVAKALGQSLTEKTIYTRLAQMIGTPLYMSPEQAEVNQLDVDTRSDVYSLGVLLYELLTGTTPFDRQRFQTAAFDEIRRIIREEDPPKPSTRLTDLGATLTEVSAKRGTDPGRLSKLVRGELDWIVMRCLEKDRTRRYETVAGLAKDLERYLADEPVEARPASVWYRARKAYRRNRTALTVTACFAALLIVGLALVSWMWQAERTARAEADHARRDAIAKAHELSENVERMNKANAAIDMAFEHNLGRQWGAAEAAYYRAIELQRGHSQVWFQRGEFYARMGLWENALRDYREAFARQSPDATLPWFKYALLQLQVGDEGGYRKTCREMVQRLIRPNKLVTSTNLIRTCALLPGEVPGFDWRSADPNIGAMPPGVVWVGHYGRGLAHFRAGAYTDAVKDLRESLARTKNVARSMNLPVLAMALRRSGQMEAARAELDNARLELDRWTQSAVDSGVQFLPWPYWYDWPEFVHYYREAYRMIEGANLPDDPREHLLHERALASLGRRK
jgi:serine/threonine protein kinase